jgi:hypothetical protein
LIAAAKVVEAFKTDKELSETIRKLAHAKPKDAATQKKS